jgi:hypothetical protein
MRLLLTSFQRGRPRRGLGRRYRLHLESLEGRVVPSTLPGPVRVPIAAVLDTVSTTSTLDPMAEEAGSRRAIPQQQFGPNTVRVQNMLRYPLVVVARLTNGNGRLVYRIPARHFTAPPPTVTYDFGGTTPYFIAIDIQKSGGGPPPSRDGVDLVRPNINGYFGYIYKVSELFRRFTVSQPPTTA